MVILPYELVQVTNGASSSMSSGSSRDASFTLPLNSLLMPSKSVIQDDIRMNLGRFELVRKKGRSEVWNLFGQVCSTSSLSDIESIQFMKSTCLITGF